MIDWPGDARHRIDSGLQKDCSILGVDGHLSRDLEEISRMCGQLHVDL